MGFYRSYIRFVFCFVVGYFLATLIVFAPAFFLSASSRDAWLLWFLEAQVLPPFVMLGLFLSVCVLILSRAKRH